MIKTTQKKQPLIPKLTNISSAIEIQQPLSCRAQKSTYVSFIQTSLKSARQKENQVKLTKTPTKSSNNSSSQIKNAKPQNIQSSQAILNVLNQNIKLRGNQTSNYVTPQKMESLEEQIQTQDLYKQIIKQRQQSLRATTRYTCMNHIEKNAKFYKLTKNDKHYLCAICAIQEAYEGMIFDLKTNTIIPKKLTKNKWTLDYNFPTTSEQQQKVQQLKEFLNLAKQLYDSAKSKKDSTTKYNIQEILEEIENISSDIINNAKNIINNVESKSFQMILQNYVQQLQQFDILMNKQHQIKKTQHKQQVLISFQNKDSFLNPDQMESTDSLMLRQSETKHFLDEHDATLYSPQF